MIQILATGQHFVQFLAVLHCACTELATCELSAKFGGISTSGPILYSARWPGFGSASLLLCLVGFSRDIPGFPTYRMNGSVSLGEHNLVIESAQLSDDAEFQCQVTPAGGDAPLVGTARLSVLGQCQVSCTQLLSRLHAVKDGRLRPRCRHLANWPKHTRRL